MRLRHVDEVPPKIRITPFLGGSSAASGLLFWCFTHFFHIVCVRICYLLKYTVNWPSKSIQKAHFLPFIE